MPPISGPRPLTYASQLSTISHFQSSPERQHVFSAKLLDLEHRPASPGTGMPLTCILGQNTIHIPVDALANQLTDGGPSATLELH